MKKILFSLLCGVMVIGATTACGIKKQTTSEKFMKLADKLGYETEVISDKFDAYVAEKNDYMIIFYETEIETVEEHYDRLYSWFEWTKKEYSGTDDYSSGKDYSKYSVTANDQYMIISRVGNTIMRVEAPIKYKQEIDKFFNKIGY